VANDDTELLEQIRSGSPDQFSELVRRHQARVFAILHRYERDAHLLQDLAQETFLKVWRALDQFDSSRAPFEHWLSRIAVHVALDHLRRRQRRITEVGLPQIGEEALNWLRHDGNGRELAARDAREILDAAFNHLSPAERLVITLMELEGRSVKETATLTGSSGVAVRVRALRARRKLRAALARLEKETK
jgi:RNA polymerase sigma-70 factor, ECF subfamily